MSESKKSGKKKVSAPRTVKASGAEKTVTVEQPSVRSSQELVQEGLKLAGVTETELKGLISVCMKWASRMEEAQKLSIEKDKAMANMALAISTVAARILPAAGRLERTLEGAEKLSRQGSALVQWIVELLDANKIEIHEGFNAIVWAAGLKGVADTATAQLGDAEASKAAWAEGVMAKKAAEVKPVPQHRHESSGTKPVEKHHHHKKKQHEHKQGPLKASMAEQLKAKGHTPAESTPE